MGSLTRWATALPPFWQGGGQAIDRAADVFPLSVQASLKAGFVSPAAAVHVLYCAIALRLVAKMADS